MMSRSVLRAPRPVRCLIAATAIGVAAAALPLGAQPGPVSFVYLQGADTIAVETVTPGNGVVRGVLSYRNQPRVEWEQTRTPLRLTLSVFAPGSGADAAPMQVASFVTRGDSVAAEIGPRGAMRPQMFASKAGAVAMIPNSLLHAALLSQLARETGQRAMPVFLTAGAQTFDAAIRFEGDTSVFSIAGMELRTSWQDGIPQEVRVPAQNLRAVRATGAVKPPSSMPVTIDYSAPRGAPYVAEAVRIPTTRGYALAGTLTRPNGAAKVPVVITISGSGPQERDSRLEPVVRNYAIFREIADTLGRRGIAVLRYDDRGVGESGGADSRAKATSADFAEDVLSVVAYLRKRPDIDASRIALAGHSEGGLIAPLAAVKDPAIRAIALLAGPAYDGRTILRFQLGNQYRALAAGSPKADTNLSNAQARGEPMDAVIGRRVTAMIDSLGMRDPWMTYFIDADPRVTLRQVKQPVLVLQGNTDMQVTPEQADTIAAVLRGAGNRRVTMHRFPETNHLFLADPSGVPGGYAALPSVKVRKEVLGTLADWMERTLK